MSRWMLFYQGISTDRVPQFNMLVSYTYRSDDPVEPGDGSPTKPSASKAPETKTFAFYTVVDLGVIVPKEEPKLDGDFF